VSADANQSVQEVFKHPMFTGLIQALGHVKTVEHTEAGSRFEISIPANVRERLFLGASIAVDGVCTTAIQLTPDSFLMEASHETLKRTLFGHYSVGQPVNLETPLSLQTPLGGHFVTGHVDGVGHLTAIEASGFSWNLHVRLGSLAERAYVIEKGSIALNGISLTVNALTEEGFWITIIPHTWEQTTLGQCQVGGAVHLEFDMLGKYVLRTLHLQGMGNPA
jgi:riboflavin synthase